MVHYNQINAETNRIYPLLICNKVTHWKRNSKLFFQTKEEVSISNRFNLSRPFLNIIIIILIIKLKAFSEFFFDVDLAVGLDRPNTACNETW